MDPIDVLTRAAEGDEAALHRILQDYLPKVYRYFCGMGVVPATAEDLTQEAFVDIWRSLGSYQGRASLMGWMMAICRRVAWRHFKGSKKIPEQALIVEADVLLEQLVDQSASQENQLVVADRHGKVRQLVQQLPLHYREVVLLHYLEGMTHQAIAEILEVAVGTVKSRLHRALHMLRPRLEQLMAD